MESPNQDLPDFNTVLQPEPFELNTEVVDKATAAAREALELVTSRFRRPPSRATPAAAPAPAASPAPPAEGPASCP